MRTPLRTSILIGGWLLAAATLVTGTFALRGTGDAVDGLADLQVRAATRIEAEALALAIHRTLHAVEVAVTTGDARAIEEPRQTLARATDALRQHAVARDDLEPPSPGALDDLDRDVQRVLALANAGRSDEALRMLREDVGVLASHRFLDPVAGELDEVDEASIRSLDRALAAAARHWALASRFGESARNHLLARHVETILVRRLSRLSVEAMMAGEGDERLDRNWQRLQRVAAIAAEEREVDPEVVAAFARWRAALEAGRANGELSVAWRVFEDELAPASAALAGDLRAQTSDSIRSLEGVFARLRAWVLTCMAVALALAAFAPFWLSRHLSSPLRRISEWADAVGRGDEEVPLPETADDEMGAAVRSLREMATAFADLTRKAETLTFYDSVTGLPNRQLLQDRLQNSMVWAQINHRMVGLLTVSLSSFKQINDHHGHDVGDRFLREAADRLAHVVRLGDLATRPGGDKALAHLSRLGGAEFTLMLSDISQASDAGSVANRIVARMSEPFDVDGVQLFADPSVGIAVYPIDGVDASQLVAHANVAAHHARIHPTSQYQYYSEAMNAAASRRLEIGSRLRGALERDELSIHLQPIRNARTGHVSCAEVLLRWNDSELGPIPPSEFIGVAEELSLIGAIGDWVMRRACSQAKVWREQGFVPIRFAVNASPLQLRDEGWADRVMTILEETGTSSDQIEIEITESSILHDDGQTVATLTALHEMGIHIALDDFGTGYSSLSYLHRFPIDRVKIDRSFVAEIGTDSDGTELTAAMLAMAQSLRLRVVAEGIETQDQADFLCARDCDELQGFLFGRPGPPEEFERFLVREKDENPGEDEGDLASEG